VFLAKRTQADFQAWRDQQAWTVEKDRRFDRHERRPPDWKPQSPGTGKAVRRSYSSGRYVRSETRGRHSVNFLPDACSESAEAGDRVVADGELPDVLGHAPSAPTTSWKKGRVAWPKSALIAGLVEDKDLARDDVDHLINPVLPLKATLSALPHNNSHRAISAASDFLYMRHWIAIKNPFCRKGRRVQLNSVGCGGNNVFEHADILALPL